MRAFRYHQPTEILFGVGRIAEIGSAVARFGKRCLLVSGPSGSALHLTYEGIRSALQKAGVYCLHFDEVVPNPTVQSIDRGSMLAAKEKVDVVLGVGGGSSMDTAKAIAVGAKHKGSAWDYLFFRETQPTEQTLPVIAVPTTSGTGSHVTQVAVMTETEKRTKSAIFHPQVYPKIAIVDPKLTVTVTEHVTASTGFDVFCHCFESYLHPMASPYTDLMALEAIRLIMRYLPLAIENGADVEARSKLSWSDTLAGLCIANAGVTLPHGIGMTIGGVCPNVMHGEALAAVYPEFMHFTQAAAAEKFKTVGGVLNPQLLKEPKAIAAKKSCKEVEKFLKKIGMLFSLYELKVPAAELDYIAEHSRDLPDYKNNPRIASEKDIKGILERSFQR